MLGDGMVAMTVTALGLAHLGTDLAHMGLPAQVLVQVLQASQYPSVVILKRLSVL